MIDQISKWERMDKQPTQKNAKGLLQILPPQEVEPDPLSVGYTL